MVDLNSDQIAAIESIQRFLLEPAEKVFVLRGYAGTGKTTLVRSLITYIGNELNRPIVLLATTGRAAKVVSDRTGSPAQTVHSHLYSLAELKDDIHREGAFRLSFQLKVNMDEEDDQTVYIVDEASMLSDLYQPSDHLAEFGSGKLLRDLLAYTGSRKVIFVGDICQLPPVNCAFSPALDCSYFEKNFNLSVQTFELTKLVRQSEHSGIARLAGLLRERILSEGPTIESSFLIPNASDIVVKNHFGAFVGDYQRLVSSKRFYHNLMYVSASNAACHYINTYVRQRMLNSTSLTVGEPLLCTQNMNGAGISNGDVVIVRGIGNRHSRAGFTFVQVQISFPESDEIKEVLMLEDLLYDAQAQLNSNQHKELMIDYSQRKLKEGIKRASSSFVEHLGKDPYLNSLKAKFGYAITGHKSQGGEWDTVFVNVENNISQNLNSANLRWLYTAVTRPKRQLVLSKSDWFRRGN